MDEAPLEVLKRRVEGAPYLFTMLRFIDLITVAVVLVDDEASIEFLNAQAEILLGWDRSELIGKHVNVLVPDELAEQHLSHISTFLTSPQAVLQQRRMGLGQDLMAKHKKGHPIPVTIDLAPFSTPIQGTKFALTIKDR